METPLQNNSDGLDTVEPTLTDDDCTCSVVIESRVRRALHEDPHALQLLFDMYVSSVNAFALEHSTSKFTSPVAHQPNRSRLENCTTEDDAKMSDEENHGDNKTMSSFRYTQCAMSWIRSVPSFAKLKERLDESENAVLPAREIFEQLLLKNPWTDGVYCGLFGEGVRVVTTDSSQLPLDSLPKNAVTFELDFEHSDGASTIADQTGPFGYLAVSNGLLGAYRLMADWSNLKPGTQPEKLQFQADLNRTFGECPWSYGWGKSLLGSQLRVVVVCRVSDVVPWESVAQDAAEGKGDSDSVFDHYRATCTTRLYVPRYIIVCAKRPVESVVKTCTPPVPAVPQPSIFRRVFNRTFGQIVVGGLVAITAVIVVMRCQFRDSSWR